MRISIQQNFWRDNFSQIIIKNQYTFLFNSKQDYLSIVLRCSIFYHLLQRIVNASPVSKVPICDTCLCEIEYFPSRILELVDESGKQMIVQYHFFYPCWDMKLLCQRYPHHFITMAGFSCDMQTLENPKIIKNYKKNEYLWI